jgi:hypothetical protein
MLVTDRTKRVLEARRFQRRMSAAGFERLGEGGGRLWEIYRGGRCGQRITQAVIEPGGMAVWVKIEK